MANDPAFRCPGCGSFLTAETILPGVWECNYCSSLFPVDLEKDEIDTIPS